MARSIAVLTTLTLLACSASGPPAGSERGPCYGNGTCDVPLACLSGLCVRTGSGDAGPDATMGVDVGAPIDGGAPVDGGALVDSAPATDAGPLERRQYVVSELDVPLNSADARTIALDLDGDGSTDNQLGAMLAAFADASGSAAFSMPTGVAIRNGALIVLVDVSAASFASGSATGRTLEGGDPSPAPCSIPSDPSTCGMHLSGTGHFSVTPPVPPSASGSIAAAHLSLSASPGRLPLVFGASPVWVPVVDARLDAVVGASGLSGGLLAGAIVQSDVDAILVPAFFAAITDIIARDCTAGSCTSGSTGEMLVNLFDADHDGTVTLDEFRTSSLISTLLRPDVDLFDAAGAPGHDGVADALSAGFGFTAVGATFPSPP